MSSVRRLAPWSCAVLVVAICLGSSRAQAGPVNPRPATIPALQRWAGGHGQFRLPASPRLVVAAQSRRALAGTAGIFAGELGAETGRQVRVVFRSSLASFPGDIVLSLGTGDRRLGHEGYTLRVAAAIELRARDSTGVFYGTRTLLQLFRHRRLVPRGVARDWPRYPVRGLMIDLGRRVYPAAWIRAEIEQLAYFKLNFLHLHLTDDQRWGIVSRTHPEIVSRHAITRRELRAILATAASYHVTLVPEIDMPGHLGALLARHPALALRATANVPASDKLDITSQAALNTVRELLDEYLPLFPGRYWDIGADEYLTPGQAPLYPQLHSSARRHYGPTATYKDAILGFVNWVNAIVRRHHKALWAWHDELGPGAAVRADADIVANWWTNISPLSEPQPPTPQQLLASRHLIINDGWFPTYYTEDVGSIQGKPDIGTAYQTWSVNRFCGPVVGGRFVGPCSVIGAGDPRNLGAMINAWDDHELTLQQIAGGLAPRLQVLAQKTWNSPELSGSYVGFEQIMKLAGPPPA